VSRCLVKWSEPRASESRAARTRGRGDTAHESQAQGEKEMKMMPLIALVATLCDERVCSVRATEGQ
jgi:hypothetical protein